MHNGKMIRTMRRRRRTRTRTRTRRTRRRRSATRRWTRMHSDQGSRMVKKMYKGDERG